MFERPSHHQCSTSGLSALSLAWDPVSPQCFLSPSVCSTPLIRFPLYSFKMCCKAAIPSCGKCNVSPDLPSSPTIALPSLPSLPKKWALLAPFTASFSSLQPSSSLLQPWKSSGRGYRPPPKWPAQAQRILFKPHLTWMLHFFFLKSPSPCSSPSLASAIPLFCSLLPPLLYELLLVLPLPLTCCLKVLLLLLHVLQ